MESWTRRIENDGYTAVVYAFRNSRDAFKGRAASGKWPPIPQIPALAPRGAIMWNAFVEELDARLGEPDWIAGGGYSFADLTAMVTIDFARATRLGDVGIAVGRGRRWLEV